MFWPIWSCNLFKSCYFPSLVMTFLIISNSAFGAKYPNEIIDTPIVQCEPESIVIKIRTTSANPSHIYAEDFHETAKCMVRNQNRISFSHNDCGMTMEHLDNPAGTMYRICLSVQIHPLFVTDSDRSYCAQCVYMDANLVDDLERNIAISEMMPNELDPQFDEASNPQCSYSIRKGTVDGPEVHAAVVGETVFHVWQCSNENVGILVQNCHVEDLQGDKILIIDQNGCGVDQYLFRTPQYSNDLHTAFLQSSVFKFVDKSMTRFRCQLRLCVKNRGKGCATVTPPSGCPSIDAGGDFAESTAPVGVSPQSAAVHRPVGASAPSLGYDGLPQHAVAALLSAPSGGGPPGAAAAPAAPAAGPLISGGTQRTGPPADGPPSIRPYGPSTTGKAAPGGGGAQIVSGRTTETLPPASSYPYVLRERRAAVQMLYGNGVAGLAAPPQRPRRHAAVAPAGGTVVQELDVVGLIRVLDNPDDIQYFADQTGNTLQRAAVTNNSKDEHQLARLQTHFVPAVSDQPVDEQRHLVQVALEEPQQDHPVENDPLSGPAGSGPCSRAFWPLALAFAALAALQLCALCLVLADRFLLNGRFVGQRVHKVLLGRGPDAY